ncbi:MAG: dihydroorotate dehydrogenase [Patescibacteria group bacterium]|nr:dihydroorotate dehydrogenase [Patescibacteria group bacterium]
MNLSIDFLGVTFPNPTVLASGILGVTGDSLKNVVRNGAGGVTSKSVWLERHEGHKNPTMMGTESFYINAVGLPDGGIEKAREELGKYLDWEDRAPLIGNIVAGSIADFKSVAEKMAEIGPDIIEVNISCPNVEHEFGKPFACVAADAAEVTKIVKNVSKNIPVIVKLSPNVEDIAAIAVACEKAGADGLVACNTFGPGIVIDIDTAEPVLANKVGGVSGPGIKPLAVKKVMDIASAVKIPVIGMGGVVTGRDVIEFMMAGASLVGIGVGVYYRGASVFEKITEEIEDWVSENGVKNLSEIIGKAL